MMTMIITRYFFQFASMLIVLAKTTFFSPDKLQKTSDLSIY